MAVSILALTMMVLAVNHGGNSAGRIQGNIEKTSEGRAAVLMLTEDLATSVWPEGFRLVEGNDKFADGPRLGFYTLKPDFVQAEEERVGDVCEVTYYLDVVPEGFANSPRVVPKLMRGFSGSATVFAERRGSADPEPTEVVSETTDEVVAYGVVSFDLQPKYRNDSGAVQQWTAGLEVPPDFFEVELIVANRSLTRRFQTADEWGTYHARWLGQWETNKEVNVLTGRIPFGPK
ncbi:MAG: hypothetical protein AAF555_04080 [Verrucomicrobiota bacterium]